MRKFWPFSPKIPPPQWWLDYRRQFRSAPALHLPPHQQRFVVLDTETTGLEPGKHQLLSIAAYGIQQGMLHTNDHFSCFLRQPMLPKPDNISIHGILPAVTREGIPQSLAIPAFLEYCGNAIIVGHHIGFDLKYLNLALQQLIPGAQIRNKSVDIINLERKLNRFASHRPDTDMANSLDQLCQKWEVEPVERHTATGDAWTTAILFLKLMKKIERGGWGKTRHLLD